MMYEEQGDQEKALQVLLIVGWLFCDLMERASLRLNTIPLL